MQGYLKYQQNKVQHQRKADELHPLEIPKGLWQEISIDIIGQLPNSNGMNAILVIVYRFMKMIRLKAMTTNISSEGIAKIYRNEYGNYMEYQRQFLATEDCNLYQSLWKNLLKYWELKENYLQHTILKPMEKPKE